jgi:peptidoglycan/xylan/chitin deacetylase (PgdA/CDA1 family)
LGDHFTGNVSRGGRTLALTFDDGPDPIHTPKVLDILKDNGVKATFFMIGERVEHHPEIVRRILDEGHEIGNHAYRHVKFAALPLRDQLAEIHKTDQILTQYDGRPWHWFRPPQGRLPLRLLWAMVRTRHRLAMWSYDSLDYRAKNLDSIHKLFQGTPVREGEVVLFHDDNNSTALALPQLVGLWREQGYEFHCLSQPITQRPF